ncbi:MAG: OmpA family protein [Myxococcota bacterium]
MTPFPLEDPCAEDWDAMRRDAAAPARHCAACDRHVYDLARMTEAEIRGIAILHGGAFCGRQRIVDGRLATLPEPVRPRSAFAVRVARSALVVGALASSGLAACEPSAHATAPVPVQVEPIPGGPTPTPAPTPTPTSPTPAPAPQPTPSPEKEEHRMGKVAWTPPPIERDVVFAAGKASLPKAGLRVLDAVAAALSGDGSLRAVTVVGHALADEAGAEALARARAAAVRDYLVGHGVDAGRLQLSSAVAAADGRATASALAHERRVEVRRR